MCNITMTFSGLTTTHFIFKRTAMRAHIYCIYIFICTRSCHAINGSPMCVCERYKSRRKAITAFIVPLLLFCSLPFSFIARIWEEARAVLGEGEKSKMEDWHALILNQMRQREGIHCQLEKKEMPDGRGTKAFQYCSSGSPMLDCIWYTMAGVIIECVVLCSCARKGIHYRLQHGRR